MKRKHYCVNDLTITVRLALLELLGSMQSLNKDYPKDRQGCKSAGGALVVCCKRMANAFVLISSLTPEMDLACLLSARDWRGVLPFKPDSLAAISLSRDQLAARTDYTWDTDAVFGEGFDS